MTSLRALRRLVLATEADARVCRISGFSFSRLKDLLSVFFSFFSFLKDERDDLLDVCLCLGPLRTVAGPFPADTDTVWPIVGSSDCPASRKTLAFA